MTEPHIMIDMESLGIGTKPVLLSLGAVKFNGDEILDEFHIAIDPSTCQAYGLEITASTVLWWMKPELEDARSALLNMDQMNLVQALTCFQVWAGQPQGLWGNGSAEDNVWLKSAYEAVGLDCPFDFRINRCYRTVKNLVPDRALMPPDELVAHDALCDARWQAKHLQAILKFMGLPLL